MTRQTETRPYRNHEWKVEELDGDWLLRVIIWVLMDIRDNARERDALKEKK